MNTEDNELDEISAIARGMHATWSSDSLLPRIQRAIAREERRQPSWHVWQLAAAAVLLIAMASLGWYAQRRVREQEFNQAILQRTALDDVERAERGHVAAIDQLEKVAGPKLEQSKSPLMVSYKEKLMLLDDAIAECQAGIRMNRQNGHLRRQLLSIYSEKQRTLQDVLREEAHENR
ncbi:MAG TPA: hypothetical protein VJZ76_15985 [Thermoanaerobaculia bacterium]|nr:hypothetical protein [Thermoanaerobaculia bacterium]